MSETSLGSHRWDQPVPAVTNADLEMKGQSRAPGSTSTLSVLAMTPRVLVTEAFSWTVPSVWKAAQKERRVDGLHEAGHLAVLDLCTDFPLHKVQISLLRDLTHRYLNGLLGSLAPESSYVRMRRTEMMRLGEEDPDRRILENLAGYTAQATGKQKTIEVMRWGLKYPNVLDDIDNALSDLVPRVQSAQKGSDALHPQRACLQTYLELRALFTRPDMQQYLQAVTDYVCAVCTPKEDFRSPLYRWLKKYDIRRKKRNDLRSALMGVNVNDAIEKCAKPG